MDTEAWSLTFTFHFQDCGLNKWLQLCRHNCRATFSGMSTINSKEKVFNFTVTAIRSVRCGLLPDLQLFDGLSSFADDQADFVGGDENLLDRTVAVHLTVEAGTVPTLLHNLTQQPLGLPEGAERGPRNTSVTTVTDSTQKRLCVTVFFVRCERGVQVIQ